ncbi:MAG: oligosaccharide flippase family protein [Candidatus Cloacimonetes bacterium]|nr:oligosaccharide flippase family protein [Candidatus Cloacimonadota bacterium]
MRHYIREVGLHSIIYTISTVAGSAMGFVLIPLLTAWLTTEQYGLVANVQSLVQLFNVLFAFGLTVTWSRFWFDFEENSREQRRFLGTTLLFIAAWSLTLTAIMVLVGPWLFARLLPGVDFYPYVAIALGTSLCMVFFNQQQIIFRVRQKSWWFAVLNIGRLVLTVGLVALSVGALRQGTLGKVAADLIVAAVSAAIALWLLLRRVHLCIDWKRLREALRYALPLLPHTLAIVVLQITDKFFLTQMRGLDTTGIYSVAFKFGSIMSIIVYSVNMSWHPFFMKTATSHQVDAKPIFARLTTYWLMAMLLVALCITLFSREMVQLFTFSESYFAAAPLVPVFVFAYLLYGLYMLAATQVFYTKKAVKLMPLATVCAGVLNILLNALLIPRWGMYGAAWATFCSHGVNLLLAFALAQHHYFIHYEWRRLASLAALTAVAVAGYYLLQTWAPGFWPMLAMKLGLVAAWLVSLVVSGFLSPSERANMMDMLRQMMAARRGRSGQNN